MKKLKYIIASLLIAFALSSFAQDDGPPEPPTEHGEQTDQGPGNRAPVGSGIFILLGLGSLYGVRKTLQLRSEKV